MEGVKSQAQGNEEHQEDTNIHCFISSSGAIWSGFTTAGSILRYPANDAAAVAAASPAASIYSTRSPCLSVVWGSVRQARPLLVPARRRPALVAKPRARMERSARAGRRALTAHALAKARAGARVWRMPLGVSQSHRKPSRWCAPI